MCVCIYVCVYIASRRRPRPARRLHLGLTEPRRRRLGDLLGRRCVLLLPLLPWTARDT